MKLPKTRTEIQVRFSDLDMLGHVSNSVYAQYFDLARIDYFREVREFSEVPQYVVASVKMDMLSEIRFDQQVVVETWCEGVGNKSMNIAHHLYANGECATVSRSVLVGFDTQTRKAVPLPSDWQATDPALIPPVPARLNPASS